MDQHMEFPKTSVGKLKDLLKSEKGISKSFFSLITDESLTFPKRQQTFFGVVAVTLAFYRN